MIELGIGAALAVALVALVTAATRRNRSRRELHRYTTISGRRRWTYSDHEGSGFWAGWSRRREEG